MNSIYRNKFAKFKASFQLLYPGVMLNTVKLKSISTLEHQKGSVVVFKTPKTETKSRPRPALCPFLS